ncbi:MAG: hypothetical protein WCG85_05275 [Polyangia bacterium]
MRATQRNRIALFLAATCLAWSVSGTVLAAGKKKSRAHGKTPAVQPSNDSDAAAEEGALPAGKTTAAKPAGEVKSPPGETRAATRETVRQESRIEFDERMLRGQSASGVIYLFQRSPSEFKSIVQVPDSFRARTVEMLTPGQEKR